ncbi:uncharacterized protein LOC133816116 [Humulus lupulus]|uniref:uncharacterized protein LOC133816116 n=1 Tax=Humulus lupulus TaxID=3486 RepID=UPI002B4015D1|nr:uncharacterized protein LOC133816116 [Humulus lupulus]
MHDFPPDEAQKLKTYPLNNGGYSACREDRIVDGVLLGLSRKVSGSFSNTMLLEQVTKFGYQMEALIALTVALPDTLKIIISRELSIMRDNSQPKENVDCRGKENSGNEGVNAQDKEFSADDLEKVPEVFDLTAVGNAYLIPATTTLSKLIEVNMWGVEGYQNFCLANRVVAGPFWLGAYVFPQMYKLANYMYNPVLSDFGLLLHAVIVA